MEYADYPYSKFNTKIDVVVYSEDEYKNLLNVPGWSRSETDHLMYLCLKFDLRWPVIVDRYSLSPPRTTEDLQERYYSIVSKIKSHRAGATEGQMKNEAFSNFDINYQRRRRTQLEYNFRKIKTNEQEEAALREELKNIDAILKKSKKLSGKVSVKNEGAKSFHGSNAGTNPNLSSITHSVEMPTVVNLPVHVPPPAAEPPTAGNPRLQSTRLVPLQFTVGIARSLTTKMQLLLNELGMPENPLPTRAVCDLVDFVRKDAVSLLTLQTELSKKESLLADLQAQAKLQFASIGESGLEDLNVLFSASSNGVIVPQSMLTNAEYAAAPVPPVTEKVSPPVTKKSSVKRKAADSSASGANSTDQQKPASKKSKKSSSSNDSTTGGQVNDVTTKTAETCK